MNENNENSKKKVEEIYRLIYQQSFQTADTVKSGIELACLVCFLEILRLSLFFFFVVHGSASLGRRQHRHTDITLGQ